MTATIQELRDKAIAEEGFCDLGDGELADMLQELDATEMHQKALVRDHRVVDAILKRLEKLSTHGNIKVDVDSEMWRKSAEALAFCVASINDRIEKALVQNEQRFDSVSKSLRSVAEALAKITEPKTEVNVAAPVMHMDHMDELNKSMKQIAGREAPAPRIRVAGSNVAIDMVPVAKAITDAFTMLSERQPQVIVEPSVSQPVIHVHVPKVKRVVNIVDRDPQGQILGSESVYEYET